MAAQPEIRIMSDFFNQKSSLQLIEIKMTPTKRVGVDFFDRLKGKSWAVRSQTRGKEMKIHFRREEETHEMILNHFKGGFWEWYSSEDSIDYPDYRRDHRFSLHFEDGSVLVHLDQFHQSYWKWGTWRGGKSPDLVLEHNEFRRYLFDHRHDSHFSKPMFQVLYHQRYFNGMNNLLSCEILARTRFSPFAKGREVLSNELFREDLFDTCYEVFQQVYELGGMQLGLWKNPFGVSDKNFKRWISIYRTSRCIRIRDSVHPKRIFYVHPRWTYEKYLRDMELLPIDPIDGLSNGDDI
jgi:formamidopyrimidine-DNA glycosylase